MKAVTGSPGMPGWLEIPMAGGKSLILQWGKISVTASLAGSTAKGYDGVASFNYPVAFPNAALVISATPLDSGETLIETATANTGSRSSATIRAGGIAIKSDVPASTELQAYVIAVGY